MNTITASFDQILDFALTYSLPVNKKRAIIREYLQIRILDTIYRQKISTRLIFIGGTSLRLLHGLDRFSEDLDFDIQNGLLEEEIARLMEDLKASLIKENIPVDLYKNTTVKRSYFELRFKNVLSELSISEDKEEKLTLKFDFETFWKGHTKEVILLNRYGFLINVITTSLDVIVVQKLFAYLNRRQTLPRDIYDIVWLLAQGAKLDEEFLKSNDLSLDLLNQAKEKYVREKNGLDTMKRKLKPFLFKEEYADKLDLFPAVLESLMRKE